MKIIHQSGFIKAIEDSINALQHRLASFETDENNRFSLISSETTSLREKVRTIDDEFSKRVKGIESVMQRRAVEQADK
jgi:hypothetical protein